MQRAPRDLRLWVAAGAVALLGGSTWWLGRNEVQRPAAALPAVPHAEDSELQPSLELSGPAAPGESDIIEGDPELGPASVSSSDVRAEANSEAPRVHGTIVDTAGAPIVGATVQVFSEPLYGSDSVPLGAPIRSLGMAQTTESGRFEVVVPTAAGACGLLIEAPGFATRARNQPPGIDATHTLVPAVRLEGRALEGGGPIAGVRVSLYRAGWDGNGRTDEEVVFTDELGHYAFDALPAGGTPSLHVQRPGVLPFDVYVELTPPRTVQDLLFDDAFELVGRVLEPNHGDRLSDVVVRFGSLETRTDEHGVFRCRVEGDPARAANGRGLGRARAHLSAWKPGYCETSMAVDLVDAMDAGVVVFLLAAGEIRGTVTDARGQPAEGAQVRWFENWDVPLGESPRAPSTAHSTRQFDTVGRAGPSSRSTRVFTDKNGAFTLAEVVPGLGEAALAVMHAGSPEIVVGGVSPAAAGETREVAIRLGTGLAIQGQLFDLGQPTAGVVQLATLDSDEPLRSTTAGVQGRYVFEGLEPGAYRVRGRLEDTEEDWSRWRANPIGPQSWTRADLHVPARKAGLGGRLVDSAGRASIGTQLWVAAYERESGAALGTDFGRARVDAEGHFGVPVEAREHACFALCTRWGLTSIEWVNYCLDRGWQKDGLELVLPDLAQITLEVLRGDTGEPVGSVLVRWIRPGADLEGQWGQGLELPTKNGRLTGPVPVGGVDLLVGAPARGLTQTRVTLTDEELQGRTVAVELWP